MMKYIVLLLSFLMISCSANDISLEKISRVEERVIGGTSTESSDDAALLLIYYSQKENFNFLCTAVLLSPSVFVTARHCVSKLTTSTPCSSSKSYDEKNIISDYPIENFLMFAGKNYPDNTYQNNFVKVKKIYHSDNESMCNDDVAVGVLEKAFYEIEPAVVSVQDPSYDQALEVIGWGLTLENSNGPKRNKRGDIKLIKNLKLAGSEIPTTEGTCNGDSGGPLYTVGTKNVHGVLSRGTASKVADGDTRPGAKCIGGISIFTRVYDKIPLIKRALGDTREVIELSDGSRCDSNECSKNIQPIEIIHLNATKSTLTCAMNKRASENYRFFVVLYFTGAACAYYRKNKRET